MPGCDGTGPRGEGPFTGGGEGYCVARLPNAESDEPITGYAGWQAAPLRIARRSVPWALPPVGAALPQVTGYPGHNACYGRRRGHRRGRRFGRQF